MADRPGDGLPSVEELRALARPYLERMGAAGLRYRLEWSGRMRTRAGAADEARGRIRLNVRLLRAHPGEILPTLVHELAHVARYARYGPTSRPHGARWKALMVKAGLPPRACHRMDVSALRARRSRFLYRCAACGREFLLGPIRHRRLRHDRRAYGCPCRRPWAPLLPAGGGEDARPDG